MRMSSESFLYFSAARAWWMFVAMGYDQVAVLDGGLAGWAASGGELVRWKEWEHVVQLRGGETALRERPRLDARLKAGQGVDLGGDEHRAAAAERGIEVVVADRAGRRLER